MQSKPSKALEQPQRRPHTHSSKSKHAAPRKALKNPHLVRLHWSETHSNRNGYGGRQPTSTGKGQTTGLRQTGEAGPAWQQEQGPWMRKVGASYPGASTHTTAQLSLWRLLQGTRQRPSNLNCWIFSSAWCSLMFCNDLLKAQTYAHLSNIKGKSVRTDSRCEGSSITWEERATSHKTVQGIQGKKESVSEAVVQSQMGTFLTSGGFWGATC